MEKLPLNKLLAHDLKQVIEQARSHVAATVNSAITLMYFLKSAQKLSTKADKTLCISILHNVFPLENFT